MSCENLPGRESIAASKAREWPATRFARKFPQGCAE